jgi:hypothetical protein
MRAEKPSYQMIFGKPQKVFSGKWNQKNRTKFSIKSEI